MGKIAIDICFLLPEKIEDYCIRINQNFKQINPLGKNDYRPHITLAMGVVDQENIKSIQKFLQTINFNAIELSIEKIKYRATSLGNKSSFSIKDNPKLQMLHEKIITHIKPYLEKGTNEKMLYKGNETGLTNSSKIWLNTFSEKTSFENYCPHITLGCYNAKGELPPKFIVDTIVLCQVGDGCTCRRVISKYKGSVEII